MGSAASTISQILIPPHPIGHDHPQDLTFAWMLTKARALVLAYTHLRQEQMGAHGLSTFCALKSHANMHAINLRTKLSA